MLPLINQPTIIMPTTPNQTQGILIRNSKMKWHYLIALTTFAMWNNKLNLTPIIRKSNMPQNPTTKLKDYVTYAFVFIIQIMELATLVETLSSLEANQRCEH